MRTGLIATVAILEEPQALIAPNGDEMSEKQELVHFGVAKRAIQWFSSAHSGYRDAIVGIRIIPSVRLQPLKILLASDTDHCNEDSQRRGYRLWPDWPRHVQVSAVGV